MSHSGHSATTACDVWPALPIHLYSSPSSSSLCLLHLFLFLPPPFYSSPPFLFCFWPLLTFFSHHSAFSPPALHLGVRPSLPSSPPLLSPSVPIRRNLIGNQSFWWKNGVGLSITVPWVLPAERGVQKRLYTGTVEGKVNAADSLSLLSFRVSLSILFLSDTHSLYLSFFLTF